MPIGPLILASRSPQRLACLRQMFPAARLEVLPPRCVEEPGFDRLDHWGEIERWLRHTARTKLEDGLRQLRARRPSVENLATWHVVAADTVIAVPRRDSPGRWLVLGQPPETGWQDTVRQWFHHYLFGRTHTAATAMTVAAGDGSSEASVVVRTEVTFVEADDRLLEWYIDTGEPRGKAGGYGIQGAGEVFVQEVRGSLSNVVGLPQRELLELLGERECQAAE